jgi:glycosyltransferase involved in cell wall biosynthesis
MYSGNLGLLHALETVIDAAEHLPNMKFVFVGDGAAKPALSARVQERGLRNVRFLPYQPRSRVAESLGAADVHLVTLLPGLSGVIEPTKIFNIMAAGRPVIAAVDAESVTAGLVREAGCGIVVAPSNRDELTRALREVEALSPVDREELGHKGRAYLQREGGRDRSTRAYREVLLSVSHGHASGAPYSCSP